MSSDTPDAPSVDEPLRVLIANEAPDHLVLITSVVVGLGHTVVAADVSIDEVGAATRRELPDVALVGLGASSDHALDLVSKIVHEASCPVIALLHRANPEFVNEAAERGIFAYIEDDAPQALQSTLEIVLRRFAEYHNLEGAFARRAVIERAKGILMATHGIDDQEAFDLIRKNSQQSGRKSLTSQKPSSPATACSIPATTKTGKARAPRTPRTETPGRHDAFSRRPPPPPLSRSNAPAYTEASPTARHGHRRRGTRPRRSLGRSHARST